MHAAGRLIPDSLVHFFKDQLDYWKPVDSANGDWTAANPNAEYFRIYGQGNNSGYNYVRKRSI